MTWWDWIMYGVCWALVPIALLIKRRQDRLQREADARLDKQAFGDFTPGRFGWVLADVRRPRTPIPCRGALGLWVVPGDVLKAIQAQLGKAA